MDMSAVDVVDCLEGVGAHRSQRAAAVDRVVNLAAADGDRGVAVDTAGGVAVGRAVGGMVHSTAAAIDVAGVDGVARPGIGRDVTIGVRYAYTHDTAADGDRSVVADVAVLAAAEHRAAHGAAAEGHVGVGDKGEGGIFGTGFTQAAAEDVAVAVDVGGIQVIGTHNAVAYIYIGVAVHRGHLATAVDVLLHPCAGTAHVHLRVGGDLASRLDVVVALTGAEDALVYRAVDEVHYGREFRFGRGGVGGQVAGAVDVVDALPGAVTLAPIQVDGDGAGDVTVDIGSAEGVADGATIDVEGHVAGDVGRILHSTFRATVDLVDGAAVDGEGHVACDGSLLGAAIDLVEDGAAGDGGVEAGIEGGQVGAAEEFAYQLLAAVVVVVDVGNHGAGDGAVGVAGAEEVLYTACLDGQVGAAGADVGGRHLAVAAAEYPAEAATLDGGHHACGCGSIAATKDTADGVVTAVDVHGGCLAAGREVGLVAAAEDLVDGEGRVGLVMVAGQVLGRVARAVDIDGDVLLRRAVGVVAAIDRAVAQVAVAVPVGLVASADVDGHHTVHRSFGGIADLAQAAAVDVAVDGAVVDIHYCIVGCGIIDAAQGRAAIDIAVDGRLLCACLVAHGDGHIARGRGVGAEAAAEDRREGELAGGVGAQGDGDVAVDAVGGVVAAEDGVAYVALGHVEGYIAGDIGCVGAAEEGVDALGGVTGADDIDGLLGAGGLVAAVEDGAHLQRAMVVVGLGGGVDIHRGSTGNIARVVVAGKDASEGAAIDVGQGCAVDVGCIGAGIDVADDVTAIDGHIGAGHRSGVAATVDVADADGVAAVHSDVGGAAIVGLVATAVDLADGVATCRSRVGAVDVDVYRALRGAACVVAAIDGAVHRTAINFHIDSTGDVTALVAAAIDITFHGAAIHSDIHHRTVVLVRAAEDAAVDGATGDIDGGRRLGITIVAAAVDVALNVALVGHHNGSTLCHTSAGGVALDTLAGAKDDTSLRTVNGYVASGAAARGSTAKVDLGSSIGDTTIGIFTRLSLRISLAVAAAA